MIKDGNHRLTITLDSLTLKMLEEYCKDKGISKTSYVRTLIEQHLQTDITFLDKQRRNYNSYMSSRNMPFKIFSVGSNGIHEYLADFPCLEYAQKYLEEVDQNKLFDDNIYGIEEYGVKYYFVEISDSLEDFSMELVRENEMYKYYVYDRKSDRKITLKEYFDNHKI